MTLIVEPGDPMAPGAAALLRASHAFMESMFPPEDNHYLSLDALKLPEITFFIAREGGETLGTGALRNAGDHGEVKSMFVDPIARGSGTGAALMAALEAAARAEGLAVMRLETGDDLYPAHRLYQRHGFTRCGPFGDYDEGPHSVFMEKRL